MASERQSQSLTLINGPFVESESVNLIPLIHWVWFISTLHKVRLKFWVFFFFTLRPQL